MQISRKTCYIITSIMILCFLSACSTKEELIASSSSIEPAYLEQSSSSHVSNHDTPNVITESSTPGSSSDFTQPKPKADEASSSINSSDSTQSQPEADAETTPHYPPHTFSDINELIAWIKTNDAADYQDGRFKASVSSLKALGIMLFPSYVNSDIELRFAEILPDSYNQTGHATVVFYYFLDNKRVVIEVKPINEAYAKQANEGDIHGYMVAQYGHRFEDATEYSTEIKIKNELISENGSQYIQYIKATIESELSGNSRNQIAFLSNGFEVSIFQQSDLDDNLFIDKIFLELISLEK